MADINVERKGTSIWPWIIGLIVLALLIWLLTEMFDGGDETTEPVTTEPVPTQPVAEPVPVVTEPATTP